METSQPEQISSAGKKRGTSDRLGCVRKLFIEPDSAGRLKSKWLVENSIDSTAWPNKEKKNNSLRIN